MRRVILVGKMWEIRHLLKIYSKKYTYVAEWLEDVDERNQESHPKKNLFFPINNERK